MTVLWPRLTRTIALSEYELTKLDGPKNKLVHEAQIFAPVGGRHCSETEISSLADELHTLAITMGYPELSNDGQRIAFDRRASEVLHRRLDLTWSEAAARDVWSFIAIVVLPELTNWRFGIQNPERWVASDLTRHTWARLWWQYVTFEPDLGLLNSLSESDLNQLLERRTIGGHVELVRALARGIVDMPGSSGNRREIIRAVSASMRRRMAFTDVRALTELQIHALVNQLLETHRAGIFK